MPTLLDHDECLCGPFYARELSLDAPLRPLHKGGGAPKQKPPPQVKIPKTPKVRMPEVQQQPTAADLPPPPVPPPQQTTTTDQGQAEDDARTSALRRRGLASGSTIMAGPYAYKPKKLGGTGGDQLGNS